ncbi:hypothetical protein [Ensifer adhaerens]|uniref:hypothetical protein n=1 Tax=Ensifer adhaerens TaxID=106592 RepID=UPI00098F2D90|nr:hypothetical protein [Ensifer adhaerens]
MIELQTPRIRSWVEAYEARLVDLQREKAALVEKIENSEKTMPDFDKTLRTAIAFLASPWKLWETGKLEDQRAVRKLVFSEHLQYAPELGFRTAETTLPFKVLADIAAQNVQVVRAAGREPLQALAMAERIRTAIEGLRITHRGLADGCVTASLGAASAVAAETRSSGCCRRRTTRFMKPSAWAETPLCWPRTWDLTCRSPSRERSQAG